MQPDELDAARLWDMLAYAQEIHEALSGLTFEEYLANKDRRLATERRLEIIGEAARNVSEAFREAHPEIPWRRIIGMRHVLAHEYGDIRQEVVFRVAQNYLPALIASLRRITPPAQPWDKH